MKYKALYTGYDFIHEENLLETLLKNRGVNDPDRLLNLSKKEVHDGMLLKNMDKGLGLLHKHIKNKSNIHIVIDSDQDGIASAAMIYLYIKDIDSNSKITYSFHKGKEHGIVISELNDYKPQLLIVPDAGTNDIEQCEALYRVTDILILDHHIIEQSNPYAVTINCMDGQYPNITLSGAGVVYKFCNE